MLKPDDGQRILDHFQLGKIRRFSDNAQFLEVETNGGVYYILAANPLTAKETEEDRKAGLEKRKGKLERLKLEIDNEASAGEELYVHQQGQYYSVYRSAK